MKKYNVYLFRVICFGCTFLINPFCVNAQDHPHDSSYFVTYPNKLTTRFYFSKKYTGFGFPAIDAKNDFQYRPNTKMTMGVGVTYRTLSLNLAYGFGFLNNDDEKGKTKSLDFEVHVFPYKWAVDLLIIDHKGLYIDPRGYAAANGNSYHYRPDATMILAGLAVYRVANWNRFSFNAAMIQNEWQKKSAGSLLYGGEAYYGSLKSDSALIPKQVEDAFEQQGINRINFFTAGAGIGYAYSLVIKKHFYLTGSLIGNLDVNFLTEKTANTQNNKTGVSPSAIYKAAIGYNSDIWDISANWAANDVWTKGISSDKKYSIPTGNYRFILAKRIGIRRR